MSLLTAFSTGRLTAGFPGAHHHPVVILHPQMQTQAQHIKFVVELYDKCHETCVQYIQFLQVSTLTGLHSLL
jgi:hypothetical protein